jgi:double-stranded uracil-DNA glycosylase
VASDDRDQFVPAGPVVGVPDVVKPALQVLFCGINPGRMSGALGQNFARPGNRFWKVLHLAGFTDRLLAPSEQWRLMDRGAGITNLVATTSRAARDLTREQLRQGAVDLEAKVAKWRPAFVAVLGMDAYRVAFRQPRAMIGEQPQLLSGARIWLLPNPSGLQARYGLPDMVIMFTALRQVAGIPEPAGARPVTRKPRPGDPHGEAR